ncbi:hypothetical protein LIA77_01315 [Sarocladium implicatum]|nr:hypothetical protein LIA77_01315 [Sarocladium implicatum]
MADKGWGLLWNSIGLRLQVGTVVVLTLHCRGQECSKNRVSAVGLEEPWRSCPGWRRRASAWVACCLWSHARAGGAAFTASCSTGRAIALAERQ